MSSVEKMEVATFGAGCFWGVEEAFRVLDGVSDTAVGYMGGHTDRPSYEEVCTDETGHAEVAQVTYDPKKISYEKLLEVFWENHDPTQLNRQGPDVGSQYRSVIFWHNDAQRKAAEVSKEKSQESGKYKDEVVTEIVEAGKLYEAEEYHQKYLAKRGLSSCPI